MNPRAHQNNGKEIAAIKFEVIEDKTQKEGYKKNKEERKEKNDVHKKNTESKKRKNEILQFQQHEEAKSQKKN